MLDFIQGIFDILENVISFFSNAISIVQGGISSLFSGAAIMPALFGVLPGGYTSVIVGCVAAGLFISLFMALMRRV